MIKMYLKLPTETVCHIQITNLANDENSCEMEIILLLGSFFAMLLFMHTAVTLKL